MNVNEENYKKFDCKENLFLSYLCNMGKDDKTAIIILMDLFNKRNKNDLDDSLGYAIDFIFNLSTTIPKMKKREENKLQCKLIYNSLAKTKMKRSEKIKYIAKKMNFKTDCIRNYLRELEK